MVIRLGLIGAGRASVYFGEALKGVPSATMVAVAARTEASAQRFAQAYGLPVYCDGWEQVIQRNDIDAVCVLTPPGLHVEMVVAAAQAGKHVIVEKPIARNLDEADRMIDACKKAGVSLSVIANHRYMDNPIHMKRAVVEGRLGRLIAVECQGKFWRPPDYYEQGPAWRRTWEGAGGGALMNQLIHTLDLMLWIAGDVTALSAYWSTSIHNVEVDDLVTASLLFRNGALGTVHGGTAYWPGYARRLEIHGEKGSIALHDDAITRWDVAGMDPHQYVTRNPVASGNATGERAWPPDAESHRRQLTEIMEAISGGRPCSVNGREGRRVLEVIRAIYHSNGRRTEFPFDLTFHREAEMNTSKPRWLPQ